MSDPRRATQAEGFELRDWVARCIGCATQEVRFSRLLGLRTDQRRLEFRLPDRQMCEVTIRPRYAFGRPRHWQVSAIWPSGSATVTTGELPRW